MRRVIWLTAVLFAATTLAAGSTAPAIGAQASQPPSTEDTQPPPKAQPRSPQKDKQAPQKAQPRTPQKTPSQPSKPSEPQKAQPRSPQTAQPKSTEPKAGQPRTAQPRAPEAAPPRTTEPRTPPRAVSRPPRRIRPRPPARRGIAIVFVGGYFYDPFFGPYPWWPRVRYPYGYYPIYETRAILHIHVTPANAAVYVDGFYAGIVDDFNGFFQGLPLPPGGHEIVLYLEGYQTIERRIYLSPGSSFDLRDQLIPLPLGAMSEPPVLAPPLPPPPTGTAIPPQTPPPAVLAAPPAGAPAAGFGTLSLRVQPADATLLIDGEPWASSEAGRFVVQLEAGVHRLEISRAGYQSYSGEVTVREGVAMPLNVSLAQEPQ